MHNNNGPLPDKTIEYDSVETISLEVFIATNTQLLLPTLRRFVLKAGFTNAQNLEEVAETLLQEVVLEALKSKDKFDTTKPPFAWLLGIAVNLVRRKQSQYYRLRTHETSIREIFDAEKLSDAQLFDRLIAVTAIAPDTQIEEQERVEAILTLVPEEDRRVIQLAIIHGLNGQELARELKLKPVTARSKLHRALRRLKAAWYEQQEKE